MPFYLAIHEEFLMKHLVPSRGAVSGTRFSMLDWVRVTGLSCTKGVWYIYDRDTGQLIRCVEGPTGLLHFSSM